MIQLSGVSKGYGGVQAVRDLRLSIKSGAFVALVGGSGSGKTTTLKMINGLILADSGDIRIEGAPIAAVEPHRLRRRIGYVFQEVGLFPHMTVAENIAITQTLERVPPAERAARVDELLDLVSLPRDFGGRSPSALSGGQRQRVGVARALAARPRLMLMDEPFGALDPVTRDNLGGEYRRLHDQLGLTTVMVTHDMTEAILLADTIVVMAGGAARAQGSPAELAASADPEVRALIDTPRRQADRVKAALLGQGAA
ncbi:MAG: ATP-binding cassette domain-containing protein [Caulobacteraceae bacterium]|nr:ATP-binding cassette domain-containing protein [Caulobacteraceae bacterium]